MDGAGSPEQEQTGVLSMAETGGSNPLEAEAPVHVQGVPDQTSPGLPPPPKKPFHLSVRRIVGILIIIAACGMTVTMFVLSAKHKSKSPSDQASIAQRYKVQTVPSTVNTDIGKSNDTITFHGHVTISDSLTLKPTIQPGSPVVGQIYYDKNSNQLGYYNGTAFVYLQGNTASSGSTTIINNFITNGSSGATVTGDAGLLALITGPNTIGASLIGQSGNTVGVNGNFNVQNGGQYQSNGQQISSQNLANDANLAKLSATQTFTGANTFKNAADSTAAFAVQNSVGTNLLSVDTTNTAIVLGSDGASPVVPVIRGGAAVGNNIIGANLVVQAPNGTGVGGSGDIILETAGGVSNPLVTLDATTGVERFQGENVADPTMTWSHTTSAVNDRILVVSVDTAWNLAAPSTATGVTYNGVALTKLAGLTGQAGRANGSVWYLINPPVGAHNVVVTFTGNASDEAGESTTYYNVDQTNPIGAFTTAQNPSGNHISTTLLGTNAGQGVFDALMTHASINNLTPGVGQTYVYEQAFYSDTSVGSFRQGAPDATTMSWTGTGFDDLNHIVVALNPEPNLTPDPLTERLRVTQSGTVGVDLSHTETAGYDLTFGGTADRIIGVNQNPTTGNGHALTIQAGTGAVGSNNGGDIIIQGGAATGSGTGGSVIVRPQTDSTNAFQIQNATGTPIVSVDTIAKLLTANAITITGNLTVQGHIISGGTAPTIAAGPAACTTPTVSVSGTDTSGTITVVTGTGCAASGKLATVTFAVPFGSAPHVLLTPAEPHATAIGTYIDSSTISSSAFDLQVTTTPASSTTYKWYYDALQ